MRIPATIVALVLPASFTFCQQEHNFAIIKPGESPMEIVREAAHIVPSPRQLEWQKLEFIAFAHFGMNTFMDQEWGKGQRAPLFSIPRTSMHVSGFRSSNEPA